MEIILINFPYKYLYRKLEQLFIDPKFNWREYGF